YLYSPLRALRSFPTRRSSDLKGGGRVIIIRFLPANNVTVAITDYRVSRINIIFRATRVVSQRKVDLTGIRIYSTPLWTVHRRCTGNIRRQPGIDQQVRLVLEAIKHNVASSNRLPFQGLGLSRKVSISQRQRKPLTASILVETGHIQGTFIQ